MYLILNTFLKNFFFFASSDWSLPKFMILSFLGFMIPYLALVWSDVIAMDIVGYGYVFMWNCAGFSVSRYTHRLVKMRSKIKDRLAEGTI